MATDARRFGPIDERRFSDTDAPTSVLFGSVRIELEMLHRIESKLELFEKISLIFLLYDQPAIAREHALLLIKTQNRAPQFLHDWALNFGARWRETLVEALLIIQDYVDLFHLGLDVGQLRNHFLPHVLETSLFVHPVKKVLYAICEVHSKEETADLIEAFRSAETVEENDFKYLELFFLELAKTKIITFGSRIDPSKSKLAPVELCDVEAVGSRLNASKFSKYRDCLLSAQDFVNGKNRASLDESLIRKFIETEAKDPTEPSTRIPIGAIDEYPIYDPKNVGYFLIINQKNFKDGGQYRLDERLGTDFDVERLRTCWRRYGFTVEVLENLSGDQIVPSIEEFIEKVPEYHSMFAVCILSHGQYEVVFGSDSKPVKVDDIKAVFYSHGNRLVCKPKLLIIQACRGDETMKPVYTNFNLKTDAPKMSNPSYSPEAADLMVFWATVAKYVSYRDTTKGSWFIETLCDCVTGYGDVLHLSDLFTKVNSVLSEKKVQISQFDSTWRKIFRLRSIKQ